jgi:di/tricarboxylate transporter
VQRSTLSKGLSSLVLGSSVTGADQTPIPSNGDDNDDDIEQNATTIEVWNNLRVLFDSNQSASGATSEVPKGEFLTAFTIPPKSPLNDKTLAELGYSKLPGVVLVSCERPITSDNMKHETMSASSKVSYPMDGTTNTRFMPISPDVEKLKIGDVLWFSGSAEAISDLQRINGLAFYQESATSVLQDRRLIQAVVARGSPLVGRTVIDVDFRVAYGGAVLAIQRGSERVHEHPGAVKLQTGDVLLIEADTSFVKKNTQNYKTFALVTEVEDSSPPRPQMFFLCLIMIGIAFGVSSVEELDQSLLVLSVLVGIAMALLGVLTQQEARDAIQWDLYVVVASAFGVSQAMTNSGVSKGLATFLVRIGNALNIGGKYLSCR